MTDEELKKLCDQIISEPKLYRDAVHVARALRERLDRPEVTREQIANIVDPSAWTSATQYDEKLDAWHESLRKADAILKLFQHAKQKKV